MTPLNVYTLPGHNCAFEKSPVNPSNATSDGSQLFQSVHYKQIVLVCYMYQNVLNLNQIVLYSTAWHDGCDASTEVLSTFAKIRSCVS